MQKDFTYHIYSELIDSLKKADYVILPFIDFISNGSDCNKCVILKRDVDRMPNNALKMAILENRLGVKASYYFRTVEQAYDELIIKKIASLGHEVSYHYEDLSQCKGNYEIAIKNFELNLKKIREFYPAKTICMHGSPLSKYDNKKIWEKFDYRDYGIIADPSFDIDYDEVFYISDTGRSWNNSNASIRDKVTKQEDLKSRKLEGKKTEGGGRKDRRLEVEKMRRQVYGSQGSEDGGRRAEVRRRKSEDRGRKLWDERKMDDGRWTDIRRRTKGRWMIAFGKDDWDWFLQNGWLDVQ